MTDNSLDLAIFSDGGFFNASRYAGKFILFDKTVPGELDRFKNSNHKIKISTHAIRKHQANDQLAWNREVVEIKKTVNLLSKISTLVFVFQHEELHSFSCLPLEPTYSLTNVIWVYPGDVKNIQNLVISWQFHIADMARIYSDLKHLLPEPPKNPTKLFDAILGRHSAPRLFIANKIKEKNLADKSFLVLRNNKTYASGLRLDQDPDIIYEPGCTLLSNEQSDTIYSNVEYHGKIIGFTHVIPASIYEQSAYSVLSETEYTNNVIMLTEKTAKKFLAKRVFISFNNKGFLAYLKTQGFQTFDSVIDESYDLIDNNYQRWEAAWKQLEWLCQQDPVEIYSRLSNVLEHNRNHVFNNPWYMNVIQSIESQVDSILTKKL